MTSELELQRLLDQAYSIYNFPLLEKINFDEVISVHNLITWFLVTISAKSVLKRRGRPRQYLLFKNSFKLIP